MKRKCRLKIKPQTVSAGKLQTIQNDLEKLGAWQNSEIIYDDSDEEVCKKIQEILSARTEEDNKTTSNE